MPKRYIVSEQFNTLSEAADWLGLFGEENGQATEVVLTITRPKCVFESSPSIVGQFFGHEDDIPSWSLDWGTLAYDEGN
jgi:hypothetical protein